jgi:hypothetical protein
MTRAIHRPYRTGHRLRNAVVVGTIVVLVVGVAWVALRGRTAPPTVDPRLDTGASFFGDAGVTIDVHPVVAGATSVDRISHPEHGTVEQVDSNTLKYVPDAGYLGDDRFTYTVVSGSGDRLQGTVNVKRRCRLSQAQVPSCGAWWGTAQIPGGAEGITAFARSVAAPPVAHLFASNGQTFPTPGEQGLVDPGGPSQLLFGTIKPDRLADRTLTWAEVAQGAADDYLRTVAASINQLGQPVLLSVHHEPEDGVNLTVGSGYTPDDYVAMYRYVVAYLEARTRPGVISWVWVVTGYPRWESLWPQLYPGPDVVDWIGYDPYVQDPAGCDFTCVVNQAYPQFPSWPGFYTWATRQFPDKPLMLAEWAVRESPTQPGSAKAQLFRSAPLVLPSFPKLRAVVYFNDDRAPSDPTSSRVETTQQAAAAFKAMVRSPYLASAGSVVPAKPSSG